MGHKMIQEQAQKWLPEITAFAQGSEIFYYSPRHKLWRFITNPDWHLNAKYIINDKHAEARKAHALDKPIQFYCHDTHSWKTAPNPRWLNNRSYRPKPEEWYNNIPRDGILCWTKYSDNAPNFEAVVIIQYKNNTFVDSLGRLHTNVEPVTKKDIK